MFKNRALQVKWIKTDKNPPTVTTNEDPDFGDKVITMTAAAEIIVKKVAMAALAYVVVDTLRQVTIERAKK